MSNIERYVVSVRKGWVRLLDFKASTSWWQAVRMKPRSGVIRAWVDVYSDGSTEPHYLKGKRTQRRTVEQETEEDETFGLISDLTGQT